MLGPTIKMYTMLSHLVHSGPARDTTAMAKRHSGCLKVSMRTVGSFNVFALHVVWNRTGAVQNKA
jgi:hypothetical protein